MLLPHGWESTERRARKHRVLLTVCRMLINEQKGAEEIDRFLDGPDQRAY